MTTGYTAAVYEGQSFQDFVRSCAKAFMYDDGSGDGDAMRGVTGATPHESIHRSSNAISSRSCEIMNFLNQVMAWQPSTSAWHAELEQSLQPEREAST